MATDGTDGIMKLLIAFFKWIWHLFMNIGRTDPPATNDVTEEVSDENLEETFTGRLTENGLGTIRRRAKNDDKHMRLQPSSLQERGSAVLLRHCRIDQKVGMAPDVMKILNEKKVVTSEFVRRDFDQCVQVHQGVRPRQLMHSLKACLPDYPKDSKQQRQIQALIDSIDSAKTDEDLRGKSFVEHIASVSETNVLTATFIVYRYRMETPDEAQGQTCQWVADALIISGSQKTTIDWTRFGVQSASVIVLGLLVDPTIAATKGYALLAGAIHMGVNLLEINAANTEANAKALLFQILIDRGFAKIKNRELYLTLE